MFTLEVAFDGLPEKIGTGRLTAFVMFSLSKHRQKAAFKYNFLFNSTTLYFIS